MLSREDNDLLCRVGPGTPMGTLMREYWIPAGLSEELPDRDGAPVRIKLLGENLIAFRDTEGTIGLVQENCPHRGASLFFGRNEEAGLRCVYHGWKFNADGTCVDMPNEPQKAISNVRCASPRIHVWSGAASSGRTWAVRTRRRRCRTLSPTCCPMGNTTFRSISGNATGCRRSRAISTHATPASYILAACRLR